jgi:hypothetical protein
MPVRIGSRRSGDGVEILEKPRKSVIIAAWKRAFPARNSWQADFSWC